MGGFELTFIERKIIMDKNYIEKIALMLTNVLDKMARDGRIRTFESEFIENDNTFIFDVEFEDIAYCGYLDEKGNIEYYTIKENKDLILKPNLTREEMYIEENFSPRYDEEYNDLIKETLKKF